MNSAKYMKIVYYRTKLVKHIRDLIKMVKEFWVMVSVLAQGYFAYMLIKIFACAILITISGEKFEEQNSQYVLSICI